MENTSLLQSFALDKDKRIRSVDEVARGLACECTCTCCGERVIARQGDVREWHFAHASGADCEHAAESALHLAAKQILLEGGGIRVPEFRVHTKVRLPDGRTGEGEAIRPDAWINFENVEAEKALGNIRPDITAYVHGKSLLIEVAVTHFADDEKRHTIQQLKMPAIEIDIASFAHDRWNWSLLHEAVIESALSKRWLHHIDADAMQQEAHNTATLTAYGLPQPGVATTPPEKPLRTRFWLQQRMVDVVERPFGLAVWSPYDPALNETIKAIVHPIGGRWQYRFKNWLVPLESRVWLFEALQKLSDKPPVYMR